MPRFRGKRAFRYRDGERRLDETWLDPEIRILGDACFIPLTRTGGHRRKVYTLIDLEDYERVTKVSAWALYRGGYTLYARASCSKFLPDHHLRLHALVLKAKHGEIVDHINGDGLDNRKQNLRICTTAENCRNARRPTFFGKTSRFKGVSWSKYDQIWISAITLNGQKHYLGQFDDEEAAARAYDEAAPVYHKEFARTNAEMNLYDMQDPFVPDCSRADEFDALLRHTDLSPHIIQLPRSIKNPLAKDAYRLLAQAS